MDSSKEKMVVSSDQNRTNNVSCLRCGKSLGAVSPHIDAVQCGNCGSIIHLNRDVQGAVFDDKNESTLTLEKVLNRIDRLFFVKMNLPKTS